MEVNNDFLILGDPEFTGEMLEILKVSRDDFSVPERLALIQKTIEFLKDHPDPEFFIRRAVGSKQVDRLEFISEYIDLNRHFDDVRSQLDSVKKKMEVYNDVPPEYEPEFKVYNELAETRQELERQTAAIYNEIKIYER